MTDQQTIEPNETDLALALQPLEAQLEAVAATVAPAHENIGAMLQDLYEGGSDENALTIISDNVSHLINVVITTNTAATMAKNVAAKALEQRDQAAGALKRTISDIKNINTDNDLIQELVDEVYTNEVEFFCETRDEAVVEDMLNCTPFDETECSFLYDVLCAGYELSDERWAALKAWMRQTRDELQQEYKYLKVVFSDEHETEE
jgi:hypothetical protein